MRKVLLLAAMMASGMLSFGQSDISEKLSISTQMFIDERDGNIDLNPETKSGDQLGSAIIGKREKPDKNGGRFIANPDTIDGKAYISAFIRLKNSSSERQLTRKGVQIQCKFDNGLYTALIPVDRIEEVARLSNVKRINVSTLMRPTTNNARSASNVDDVLTKSADAVAAGLSSKYDGSGVVLGVIDTGIDFQHIAFKDADGNSRIKRAYVYNGSSAKEYTSISSSSPTTDDSSEDHGTHTSSTAGGSSVIINGSSVTVTDDHANATYGGMAPGADLYLAGINGLSSTYLANAFQKICNYADGVDKPVVVSNSWGSQYGPHDGTGDFADITAQYFGDSHPNHICLFAASNDAGKSKDNEGGGYHIQGTASSSSPIGSILRSATYSDTDAGYYYYGIMANAWSRSTSTSSLACKILVLDSSTGAVKTSVTVTPSSNGTSVSGLSSYYSGTLYAYKDYVSSDKTQILLYTSGLESKSYSKTTKNGSTYYTSAYTLAVQFYPTSGSCTIDAWGGTHSYYTDYLTTSGYTWTDGSDNSSVSDEATDPNVIAIGAYVTKNSVTDYNGTTYDLSGTYTLGDIAYFSSYQEEGVGPTGDMLPWISAPGATIVSAVNHYDTSGDYSYINDNSAKYGMYRVNDNTTSPYGTMEGTSMATPAAAGIVALWLQAALEAGKELTVNDVKTIMKETAITDAYTSGTNGTHFGNGKIDALAGIQSILGTSGTVTTTPVITASETSLAFSGTVGETYTKTFTVTGTNLEGAVTVTLSGSSDYTVSPTSISVSDATQGATVTVTYAPTASGSTEATLTLTSSNAESVTVSLSGTATIEETTTPVILADPSSLSFSATAGSTETKTLTVSGTDLEGSIAVAVSGTGFSVDATTISSSVATSGTTLNVTFTAPETTGEYTGTLTLTSTNAETVTVALTGTSTAASSGETTSKEVYLLVSSVTSDSEYVIADSNAAGSANAVSNSSSNSISNASVTIVSGTDASGNAITYIENPSEYAVWTSGTNSSSFTFANNSYYLYHSSGSLSVNKSTSKNNWTVGTDATSLYYTGGNTTKYLTYSSGWTISTSASNVYFYEKTTITVAGGGEEEEDPVLTVDPTSLSFETEVGTSVSQTFTVTGSDLTESVSVSLTDANGVYSVSPTTISASDAEAGVTVTVTFDPLAAGTYTGTVTLTSGSASASVSLNGEATAAEEETEPNGGEADDTYLNLHKYTTVDEVGYSSRVDNLVAYTEQEDGTAWLTMSPYGAYCSIDKQTWITAVKNAYYRTTWSAEDIFLGSSAYFASGGNALISNPYLLVPAVQTYYVYNCTGFRMKAYNPSSSKTVQTTITVNAYELNEDGSFDRTSESTAVSSDVYNTKKSYYIATVEGLDAKKVYEIQLEVYRTRIYEVGFHTTQSSWTKTESKYRNSLSGISDVMNDDEEVRIYNLQGVYLGNDVKQLEQGMYIIDGKKVNIKK